MLKKKVDGTPNKKKHAILTGFTLDSAETALKCMWTHPTKGDWQRVGWCESESKKVPLSCVR